MAQPPRTSIVIAVKADNPYLRECLAHCGRLREQDFEILVLPDFPCELPFPKTRVIPTGTAGPSHKRDLGLREAAGEIVAFLDDDAFPAPEWLSASLEIFTDPGVAAIGGPAVTPPEDGPRQQASGLVYSSLLAGGPYAYRYLAQASRDVDDYPTCNLLIRRRVLLAIGGFDTCFWPGEDTVVCLKITRELKQRIVYDPRVLVYHHRRPLFAGHLKQVVAYAAHRGYFVKRFPATSLRPGYFLPTLLDLGLLAGWLPALFWPVWLYLWLVGCGLYFLLALLSGLAVKPRKLWLLVAAGIVATQVAYGFYFVRGLLTRKLREEV